MRKYDKVLLVHYNNFCGVHFYAAEYFIYFLENNYKFELVFKNCTVKDQVIIMDSFKDKYEEKYYYILKENIIFTNDLISTRALLVLDFSTVRKLDKVIFYKGYYHYTDEIDSLTFTFQEFQNNNKISGLSKLIDFGDQNIGSKCTEHYPLMLNFKMFKKIKTIQKRTFLEDKVLLNNKREIHESFHAKFNTINFYKTDYDRANRLILECKYYGKHINFNTNENDLYDSTNNRFENSWELFDINNSTFIDYIHTKDI